MIGLKGKRVLVTGASSGIGQGIAIRFAQEGADVGLNFRSGIKGVQETERQIRAFGNEVKTVLLQADVSEESDVDEMFDAFTQSGLETPTPEKDQDVPVSAKSDVRVGMRLANRKGVHAGISTSCNSHKNSCSSSMPSRLQRKGRS